MVLFAEARKRTTSRGRHWVMTRLAGAAFCGLSLVTPRAVLLLPTFFLISLVLPRDRAPAPAGIRRLSHVPDLVIPLTVWALVVLIGQTFAPVSLRADLGAVLYPLLGPRWSSNGLWLFVGLVVLAVWRPLAGRNLLRALVGHGRFDQQPALTVSRLGTVVTAGWLLLLAAIYRWLLPGQAPFARYLVWMALPFLLWALLTLIVATSDRRRLVWLLPAVAIIWLGRSLTVGPAIGPAIGPTIGPTIDPAIDLTAYRKALGGDDLLLVAAGVTGADTYRLPLERVGRNRTWIFGDREHLHEQLDDAALLRTFPAVWALLPPDHDLPALVPEPPPYDLTATARPADQARFLYRFRPERLPQPLTVFADAGRRGLYDHLDGLYDDRIWTGDRFTLDFTVPHEQVTRLDISLRGWRPPAAGDLLPGLVVQLNGQPLQLHIAQQTYLSYIVPPGLLHAGANRLVVTAPVFTPQAIVPGSDDERTLGVDLATIVLR